MSSRRLGRVIKAQGVTTTSSNASGIFTASDVGELKSKNIFPGIEPIEMKALKSQGTIVDWYKPELNITGTWIDPDHMQIGANGQSLYLAGASYGQIVQFDLSEQNNGKAILYKNRLNTNEQATTVIDAFAFSANGSLLWVHDAPTHLKYTLSTPWDISTATYSGTDNDVTDNRALEKMWFSSNGTYFYTTESNSTDNIMQCELGTPFEIGTNIEPFTSNSLDLDYDDFHNAFMSHDGTQLVMISDHGSLDNYVYVYNLTTPWEISTATWAGRKYIFGEREDTDIRDGVYGMDSGNTVILLSSVYDVITTYQLSTNNDFMTAQTIYDTSATLETFNNSPGYLHIIENGTKAWASYNTTDDDHPQFIEYGFTTAYDQTTQYQTGKIWSPGHRTYIAGFDYGNNGQYLYLTSNYPDDRIYRYTLNTAYDISTANMHPDSWQTLNINSVEQSNYSVTVKPDGTKLYHTGRSGDDINEWTLSTPWDLTSATHDGQTTLGGATTAWQHRWSSDGSKLYLINETGDLFKTYSLTTAWDSSTIGTPTDYAITSLDNAPRAFDWNADGTEIFVMGTQYDDRISKATLSTAYDITTMTVDTNRANIEITSRGLYFANTGAYAFVCNKDNDQVVRITASEDGNWIFNTAVEGQSAIDQVFEDSNITDPVSIWFKTDGTSMYVLNYNQNIYQYTLTSAWDLSTASYASKSYAIAGQLGTPSSFAIDPTGTTLICNDLADNGGLKEFTLSTPWDISTTSATSNVLTFAEAMVGMNMNMSYDGKHVYLTSVSYGAVYDLHLDTAWDITSYNGTSKVICPSRPAITPTTGGAATDPTGTKLYVLKHTTALSYYYDADKIVTYNLDTPHDVGSIRRKLDSITLDDVGEEPVSAVQAGGQHYYAFIMERDDSVIWTYNLNDNFNDPKAVTYVSGGEYHDYRLRNAARAKDAVSVTMYIDQLWGMKISSDENHLYMIDEYGFVQHFTMDKGDVKTLQYSESLICQLAINEVSQGGTWRDVSLSADGVFLYVSNSSTDKIYRFRLNTPYYLNDVTYLDKFTPTNNVGRFDINHDGSRIYTSDYTTHRLRYYELSTKYSLASAGAINPSPIFFPISDGTDWQFKFSTDYGSCTVNSGTNIFRITGFPQGKPEQLLSNTDVTSVISASYSPAIHTSRNVYNMGRQYTRGQSNTYLDFYIDSSSQSMQIKGVYNGVSLPISQSTSNFQGQTHNTNQTTRRVDVYGLWCDFQAVEDTYQRAQGYPTQDVYYGRCYYNLSLNVGNIQGFALWGALRSGSQKYAYGGWHQTQGAAGPNAPVPSNLPEYQTGGYIPNWTGTNGAYLNAFCFHKEGTYLYIADEDAVFYQIPLTTPWDQTTGETALANSSVKKYYGLNNRINNTYDGAWGFNATFNTLGSWPVRGMDFNDSGDVLAMAIGNTTESVIRFLSLSTPWDITTATPLGYAIFPYKDTGSHYWEFGGNISFRNNKLTCGFRVPRGSSTATTAAGNLIGMEMSLSADDIKTYESVYTFLTANTAPPATFELNPENLTSANVTVSAVDDDTITYYASVTSGNGNIFDNTYIRNGLEISSSNGTFLLLANTSSNSTLQGVTANVTFTANSADVDAPITLGTTLVTFNFAGSYGKQFAEAYVAGTGGSVVEYSGGSGTDITSTLVGMTNGDCLLLPEGQYDLGISQGAGTYSSEPFNNKECAIVGDTNDPANVVVTFDHNATRDKPIFSTSSGTQTPTDKRQMAFLTLTRVDGSTTNYIAALIRGNGGNAKGRLVNVYFENQTSSHYIAWGYDNSSLAHDVQFIRCTFANYAAWANRYNMNNKGTTYAKDCLYSGAYDTDDIYFYGTNQASATIDTTNRTYNTSTYPTAGHLYVPSDFTNDANTS